LISLLIAFIFLYNLHTTQIFFENTKIFGAVITTVIIYFIMRLGVATTVHSFIKNQNLGLNMYYIFIGVLALCVLDFVKILISLKINKNLYYIKPDKYKYILIYSYTLVVILSALILLNFNLNVYSYIISLECLYTVVTLIILFSVWVYSNLVIYNIVWLSFVCT